MGIRQANQVFQVADPFPGASGQTRRSLALADLEHPDVLRIVAACKLAKLVHQRPIYKFDCWAHVGIPAAKVAIYCLDSIEMSKIARSRRLWEAHGWRLFAISSRHSERMTTEALAAHLGVAVKGQAK